MTKAFKEVNSNKNSKLEFKLFGEAQLKMKLQRIVAFIYLFLSKAGSSIPSETKI